MGGGVSEMACRTRALALAFAVFMAACLAGCQGNAPSDGEQIEQDRFTTRYPTSREFNVVTDGETGREYLLVTGKYGSVAVCPIEEGDE